MCQEAGDSACLQQAACWAWRAGGGGGGPPRAPLSTAAPNSTAPPAKQRAALAAQAFVQHGITRKSTPANLVAVSVENQILAMDWRNRHLKKKLNAIKREDKWERCKAPNM